MHICFSWRTFLFFYNLNWSISSYRLSAILPFIIILSCEYVTNKWYLCLYGFYWISAQNQWCWKQTLHYILCNNICHKSWKRYFKSWWFLCANLLVLNTMCSCQKMLVRDKGCSTLMTPVFLIIVETNAGHPGPVSNRVVFQIWYSSSDLISVKKVIEATSCF